MQILTPIKLKQLKHFINMHKHLLKSLLIIVISTVVFGCKSAFKAEKPRESYIPLSIAPAISEIPIPIEIDVKKLEASINRKINGLVFEGEKLNNQDLSVKIWKAQNFTFTVRNNVIEYRVPLKLWTRFAWTYQKFGITVGDNYEANGSLALNFRTTIEIDRNWKLAAKTTSHGFQWLEVPRLNVIGVNVPVTPIANIALQKSEKLITDEIDAALSEMVDLKKYVGMAWTEAQKPMLLNQAQQIWIRLTPTDISVSPFTTQGQLLKLTATFKSQIETFMGAKPQANKATALPAYKQMTVKPTEFNINIGADATYEKITELAKSQLVNRTFTEGKKSITITDLTVFGSEGKPIFAADVTGSLKGRIYFSGTLAYNAEKLAIEVQNPEFDVKTKNALLKSASWLLNGLIIRKISPFLTYPVKSELEAVKKEANESLKNMRLAEGIFLNGYLSDITVKSLNLVPGAIRLHVNLKGNVSLKIDELNL